MPAINITQASQQSFSAPIENKKHPVPGQKEGLGKLRTPTTLWKQYPADKQLPREPRSAESSDQSVNQRKIEPSGKSREADSVIGDSRVPDVEGLEVSSSDSPSSLVNEIYIKTNKQLLDQLGILTNEVKTIVENYESGISGLNHTEYRAKLKNAYENRRVEIINITNQNIEQETENTSDAVLLPLIIKRYGNLCQEYMHLLEDHFSTLKEKTGFNMRYNSGTCGIAECVDTDSSLANDLRNETINETINSVKELLYNIKIKMEDIMIKHGYNVQLPEDNEEFSEAFNQWNDEIVNIINSA
ncbi:hypothetical protein, partial [Endozoicomonas sp.]|uniref:hypothetical protein n=1 Tax=Endozoicomonas sp. TaxID=1892382 RepID=UPI00383BDB60